MKSKIYIWLFILALPLIFSTCKSSRKLEGNQPKKETAIEFNTFNSKCELTLSQNKTQSIKVGGDLRIKRDSMIILSIQPISGVEVGRLTCDREGIVLIDRINKRYFAFDFNELKDKMNADLNYEALQGILVGELFAFGKKEKTSATDFSRSEIGNMILLQRNFEKIAQEYVLNDSLQIQSGVLQEESYRIRWSYSNPYKSELGKTIPKRIEITLHSGMHLLGQLDFDYKRIDFDKDMNFSSHIPANYVRVSYTDLLKMIAN